MLSTNFSPGDESLQPKNIYTDHLSTSNHPKFFSNQPINTIIHPKPTSIHPKTITSHKNNTIHQVQSTTNNSKIPALLFSKFSTSKKKAVDVKNNHSISKINTSNQQKNPTQSKNINFQQKLSIIHSKSCRNQTKQKQNFTNRSQKPTIKILTTNQTYHNHNHGKDTRFSGNQWKTVSWKRRHCRCPPSVVHHQGLLPSPPLHVLPRFPSQTSLRRHLQVRASICPSCRCNRNLADLVNKPCNENRSQKQQTVYSSAGNQSALPKYTQIKQTAPIPPTPPCLRSRCPRSLGDTVEKPRSNNSSNPKETRFAIRNNTRLVIPKETRSEVPNVTRSEISKILPYHFYTHSQQKKACSFLSNSQVKQRGYMGLQCLGLIRPILDHYMDHNGVGFRRPNLSSSLISTFKKQTLDLEFCNEFHEERVHLNLPFNDGQSKQNLEKLSKLVRHRTTTIEELQEQETEATEERSRRVGTRKMLNFEAGEFSRKRAKAGESPITKERSAEEDAPSQQHSLDRRAISRRKIMEKTF